MSVVRSRLAVLGAIVIVAGAALVQTASARSTAPAPRAPKKHVVKMITEDGKQLFDPVDLTIMAGDTVSWLAVSGSHNVGFWEDSIPKGAAAVLRKIMPDTIAPLLGVRKPVKGTSYDIVFTGAPKGLYRYYCKPHLNKQMVGTLTIK
jgi:plastocyanin